LGRDHPEFVVLSRGLALDQRGKLRIFGGQVRDGWYVHGSPLCQMAPVAPVARPHDATGPSDHVRGDMRLRQNDDRTTQSVNRRPSGWGRLVASGASPTTQVGCSGKNTTGGPQVVGDEP